MGIECCENHEEGFSYGNILKRRSADLRGQYRTVQCGHGAILEAIAGTKRASHRTYTRDDKITYVITMNNTSPTPITTITITDNLGQGTYDGQVLVPDAVVQAGPPNQITVPAATYSHAPDGIVLIAPGEAVLTVSGTV